jgi:hypothetical protein
MGADLETGMYYGGGNRTTVNNQSIPLPFDFVTGSVKGRTDGFTIKGESRVGRLFQYFAACLICTLLCDRFTNPTKLRTAAAIPSEPVRVWGGAGQVPMRPKGPSRRCTTALGRTTPKARAGNRCASRHLPSLSFTPHLCAHSFAHAWQNSLSLLPRQAQGSSTSRLQ